MLKKVIAALVEAGFPYMSCELVQDKYDKLHTEIRVGGHDCHDGFLRDVEGTYHGRWTGHFYGVKFNLTAQNVCWLVANAYDIAYCKGLKGHSISDADISMLLN